MFETGFRQGRAEKSYSSARSGRALRSVIAPPLLVFAVFGVSILLQIPAGYILHKYSFTVGMLLNQIVTLLIPVIFAVRFFDLTTASILQFKKVNWMQVVCAALMICSLAIITDYLVFATESVLPVGEGLDEKYRELMHVTGLGSFVYKFAFLCIMPAFCEEIYFRGFCQTGLANSYGMWAGIFMTAGLFSVAHLSPYYIHLFFFLGVILSWLFATSGSLWIPIICHFVNNTWTFVTHALGFKLPLAGMLPNIAIVFTSALIFILTVCGWRLLLKCDPAKDSD